MSNAPRKLSSVDASFLYLETPEMPMHVGSMAIFRLKDGYQGDFFEDFKAMIASRIHIAPILKARLAKTPLDIDHPSWVEDDQFDIDRHIFRAALPAPHSRANLERTVGWMHAKLLNRARPLWEFYVFEGMENNEIGLYSKIHHACIDGGAGAALTNMIYDISPEPRAVPKPAEQASAKREPRDIAAHFIDSYQQLWSQPLGASSAKDISLPRIGKGDLGSVLFDNAMFQIENAVKFAGNRPRDAQEHVGDGLARRRSEIARQHRRHDVAVDRTQQGGVVRAQLRHGVDLAVAGKGHRQAIGRQAERRRAGAVERRAAPLPARARRAAGAAADRGGADLAARGRQRGCEQPGVRHGVLARHANRGSEGAAAGDHRRVDQIEGAVASDARAGAAALQRLDAGRADRRADPRACSTAAPIFPTCCRRPPT